MIAPREPLRCVAVIGGGQVALLAACAIRRALPATRIVRVERAIDPAALADAAATTLPSLARLHARIGIDEAGMIARAAATHRLATRYRGWAATDFLVSFGAAAASAGGSGFDAWGGGARAARDSAPAAALAADEAFAAPSDDPASPLADLDYALRFSPALHLRRLASLAGHLGVDTVHETPTDADLVVDTVAPIERGDWHDWSGVLPIDRLVLAVDAPPALSVADEAVRLPFGWILRSPGRDATRVMLGYRSSKATPAEAAKALERAGYVADREIRIAPGRADEAWRGDTVRIGDAAAAFEPLGSLNLHLAVRQIELLLDLLPGRDIAAAERAEYNRRAATLADRTRDYIAAHFDDPALEVPVEVARARDLLARRGRLPLVDDDGVPRDLWLQLFAGLGHGIADEPRTAALPTAMRERAARVRRERIAIVRAAGRPYREWLREQLR